ncbi:MAG: hypothetical protein AB9903_17900 [Vulcanimicrobiota bacterium]
MPTGRVERLEENLEKINRDLQDLQEHLDSLGRDIDDLEALYVRFSSRHRA